MTDEVWSWWHTGSIHRAPWPGPAEVAPSTPEDPAVLDVVGEVLAHVRRRKTEAKLSQRASVERLSVAAPADFLAALTRVRATCGPRGAWSSSSCARTAKEW